MFRRIIFLLKADRLGPDFPLTHLLLYHPISMRWICKMKFKYFGENSEFRPGAYADNCSSISIGSNVVVRPGTMLFSEAGTGTPDIIIEADVQLGPGIHMYVPNHSFKDPDRLIVDQGFFYKGNIIIRRGAWVGGKSIILSGVEIGDHSVVAAGSVVTENVASYTVVAGNPARVIKKIE